ncbi:hypothetical protein HAX54_018142 [Datura stramonium]|uniref:Uncharacterized protein n=1 Tax=Datura stramonium TaxID=4076 RepID=A0ABS8S1S4_DATST|nr:hypothetical protein [Datura stramonium]
MGQGSDRTWSLNESSDEDFDGLEGAGRGNGCPPPEPTLKTIPKEKTSSKLTPNPRGVNRSLALENWLSKWKRLCNEIWFSNRKMGGFFVTHVSILTSDISRFRGKPAISDLGWPFTPGHNSSPYFATYVDSVLQGLLELSSTCSWLDRLVSGQIGRTRRFHLWKAPTPNGLSRCSHFLADPSCKRYAVRVSALYIK